MLNVLNKIFRPKSYKILANFDNEVSAAFLKILKKQGMKFHLSHKVVGGSTNSNGATCVIESVKVK